MGGGGVLVHNYSDIQLIEIIVKQNQWLQTIDGSVFFAAILYSDADVSLRAYIRENFSEMHRMSGFRNIFMVIEKPPVSWHAEVVNYLSRLSGRYFNTLWERIGDDLYRPYDRTKVYEIAKIFGLSPKQLPCIVIFSELKNRRYLAVEINEYVGVSDRNTEGYSHFFRNLFTHMNEVIDANTQFDDPLQELQKVIAEDNNRRHSGVKPQLISLAFTIIQTIAQAIQTVVILGPK